MRHPGLDGVERSLLCADAYPLRYRVWLPEGRPRATLVLLNGIMSHSRWFEPLVAALLRAGVALVGADRRGTGLNQQGRGDAPSAQALLDDLRRIVDAERGDGVPLHLVGWCWGAVLAVNMAAAYPDALASLVLLAPGMYPTAALSERMAAQEPLRAASAPDCACLASPIAETMFTDGPYLADFILTDMLRTRHFTPRFHGVMGKLGMGAAVRLGQLELPMLLVLADADQATDNARTRAAFGRIKAPLTSVQLPGAHGLQFDAPDQLADLLAEWVGQGADHHHTRSGASDVN